MHALIKELEELLEPTRLRQTRFRNEAGLVVSKGLTYRQIHALRREGRVSPSLFDILSEIAPPADRPRLRELYVDYKYQEWRGRPTTSTVDLLRRARTRPGDRHWQAHSDYFTHTAKLIAEKSGISPATITVKDAGAILDKEVLSPREAGDYGTAMMNGIVLFKWWQNRLSRMSAKPSHEHLAVASALLSGLARATGQAENLPLHRALVRLAREVMHLHDHCGLARRNAMDMTAGWMESGRPGDIATMREALCVYDDEAEVAARLIRQPEGAIRFGDAFWSVTETFFNRANTALRLDIPRYTLASYLSELDDRSAEVAQMLRAVSTLDHRGNTPHDEARLFYRMLHVRYYDKIGKTDKALECASEILAEVPTMPGPYPFLAGNIHVLCGMLKMREREKLQTTILDQEIAEHRRIAIECFDKVSNVRMRNKATNELRLTKLPLRIQSNDRGKHLNKVSSNHQ
jgi:hypothetical protein